jgi:hypothetical protein
MSITRLPFPLTVLRQAETKHKPSTKLQPFSNRAAIIYSFVRYRFKWVRPVGPPKESKAIPTLRQYLQSLKGKRQIKLRRWRKKLTPLNPYGKLPPQFVPVVQEMIIHAKEVPIQMTEGPVNQEAITKEIAEEKARLKELRRRAIREGGQKSKKELEEEAARKAALKEAARKKKEEAEKAKQQQQQPQQQQQQPQQQQQQQQQQPQQQQEIAEKSSEPKKEERTSEMKEEKPSGQKQEKPKTQQTEKEKSEAKPVDNVVESKEQKQKEIEEKLLKMWGLDRMHPQSPVKREKITALKELLAKVAKTYRPPDDNEDKWFMGFPQKQQKPKQKQKQRKTKTQGQQEQSPQPPQAQNK